ASISRCFCSQSKKPPQVPGALLDVLDVVESLRCDHVKNERECAFGKSTRPQTRDRKQRRSSARRRRVVMRPGRGAAWKCLEAGGEACATSGVLRWLSPPGRPRTFSRCLRAARFAPATP